MMTAKEFKEEVMFLAQDIGVEPKEIQIRKMKRKWGSCSSKGRLTFATALLEKPKDFRLKAVLHELLHLKYPNHGRMFRTMLNNYLEKNLSADKR
ncbi:MAG: M48 family metallopeptidase [Kosmotoga sp.]|jgi:hypothetical protein|nr:MAG: M48 family metallopeptidase [Kosmotoga sp.]